MDSGTNILAFGEFGLDFQRLELRRNGERVDIKRTPFRVLVYLAQNRDRTVSGPELLETLSASATSCGASVTSSVPNEASTSKRASASTPAT